MSEKLPPRVKQTAVDHRLAVESGSAGWDQPGGKPYKQSPTPKTRKPKLPAGDGMDPMFLPAPQYKKPARVRPEKAKKKQKAKLPKQPPNVDQVLMDLIDLPVVGDDVWDILLVEPLTVGARAKSTKATRPAARKAPASGRKAAPRRGFAALAEDLAVAETLEDVTLDKPPPFRGV